MRIGPRFRLPVSKICVANQALEWSNEIKFLGVSILANSSFKCNFQIVRQKFFRALNGIFGKIGTHSSTLVTLSLINSYCVPVLTYGIESINATRAVYNVLDNAYMQAFAKLFGSFDKSVLKNCQFYCDSAPLCDVIDLRRLKFLHGLKSRYALSIRLLFEVCGIVEFNDLLNKHHLTANPINCWKLSMWNSFRESLVQ